jgi:hypothetical protein
MTRAGLSAVGLALFVLLALLDPPAALAQCSMCKAVVAQSPEGQRMAGELNKAILLMFAAPYLIFGSCAAVLFRSRLGRATRRLARFLALPR